MRVNLTGATSGGTKDKECLSTIWHRQKCIRIYIWSNTARNNPYAHTKWWTHTPEKTFVSSFSYINSFIAHIYFIVHIHGAYRYHSDTITLIWAAVYNDWHSATAIMIKLLYLQSLWSICRAWKHVGRKWQPKAYWKTCSCKLWFMHVRQRVCPHIYQHGLANQARWSYETTFTIA